MPRVPSIFIIDYDYFSVCVTFDLHLSVFARSAFFLFIIIIPLFFVLVRVHMHVAGFVGKEHGWTTLKFLKTDNKWYYVSVFMSIFFIMKKSIFLHRISSQNTSCSPQNCLNVLREVWRYFSTNTIYFFDAQKSL